MSTGAYLLTKPEVLVTLGIVPDYDHASFTLIDENSKEITLDLTPIKGDPNTAWVSASKTQPLFRQNQNNPFWFTYLEDIQAVFLSFKKYDDLNQNADKLFDFIEEKKATRLIVDLRFNGGVRFQERPQAIAFADQIKSTDQSKGKFICDQRQENFFRGVTCCCEA